MGLNDLSQRIKFALEGWTLSQVYNLIKGSGEARRIWLKHIREQDMPHLFQGCPPCEMARALRLPRNHSRRWWQ